MGGGEGPDGTEGAEAFRERIRRMTELLAGIAGHAQDSARDRCPYMNIRRLCTAEFRCRNQRPAPEGADRPFACGHAGGFDYRNAWESRPASYEETRAKLRRIREEAAARRRDPGRGPGDAT